MDVSDTCPGGGGDGCGGEGGVGWMFGWGWVGVWVGQIKIKDQLSPAEAETGAELGNMIEVFDLF